MKLLSAPLRREDGFTLIEALVAMVVLTIGILAVYSMQIFAIQSNSNSSNVTIASTWAATRVEQVIATSYDDLIDTDGDGTNQDSDADGVDDVGINNNFGLDDLTAATADGNATSAEGDYTVFWNVAVDLPLAGVKTIRIYIQDNNLTQNNIVTNNITGSVTNSLVTVQYLKEEPI